ncbi:hypothetical protein ACFOHT_04900 [Massilia oculi]|uniref:Uncharacterized protein n=1 Tax=Massilia oculi TaxID=945844 RepID=A0A2S2DEX6_9BURK|nr:hypothetical protein [Massilia oculi]AWL03406.1 hypothetical protein DIR46_02350 [Massilia oculi]
MAARDYTWLLDAVVSWSHRKDLTPRIPDFVMLAEERMSADLEARGIESSMSITTVAGQSMLPLPTEVIEIRSIGVPGAKPLGHLTADSFNARYDDATTGRPACYATIGDFLYLGPSPDGVYQLNLSARMTLPPLADAEDGSNWLIARNPSLYLAATMAELMIWVRDQEGLATWEGKYQAALGAANSTKGTAGDLVVRNDTSTP